jgi:hypothetical protein
MPVCEQSEIVIDENGWLEARSFRQLHWFRDDGDKSYFDYSAV